MTNNTIRGAARGFDHHRAQRLAAAGLTHALVKLHLRGVMHQLTAVGGIVGKGHQYIARAGLLADSKT